MNRAGKDFLKLSHSLTNFKIQKYYQNDRQLSQKYKSRFNSIYSRNNLPKIKDEAYVIDLDEYKSIGTHWIAKIKVEK